MDKQVDTLVISFKFPPTIDTSGIVAAKRIIKNKHRQKTLITG